MGARFIGMRSSIQFGKMARLYTRNITRVCKINVSFCATEPTFFSRQIAIHGYCRAALFQIIFINLITFKTEKMSTITSKDGTEIYYKDWGKGQPIVFHHGWPLSSDDWDAQMLFFLDKGYRVIAHDRRGHGRSTQTDSGNDMDQYAADVAELTTHLDLHDAVHVGHSTGGGEAAHYAALYGKARVAKLVL